MERLLTGRDRRLLERFLSADAAETMFLRSNMSTGSITEHPEGHYDGAYVGSFSGGLLVGVVCHTGNGMLLGHGDELAKATNVAVKTTGGEVRGVTADFASATAMLESLKLGNTAPVFDSVEVLYELPLADLETPSILEHAGCRLPTEADLDLLAQWREAYAMETMGVVWGSPRESMKSYMDSGSSRVLEVDGELVSYCHLNARLPDMVQIGGVWTPRELRGQGYGRAVVAGILAEARDRGVETGILFTAQSNVAAKRAYEALGFQQIGTSRLVIFDPPVTAG